MINLDDMERDPWPTWPVRKDDLRKLASALQAFEEDNRRLAAMLDAARGEVSKLRLMVSLNLGEEK
jgi:hypothetical protein